MIKTCLTCGCGLPLAPHGDPGNLRLPRLRRAAAAAGLPLEEAAWNIPRTLAADADGYVLGEREQPALIFDCDGILAFTAEALTGALNSMFGASYSPLSQEFFPGTLIESRLPPEQAVWVSGLMGEPAFLATLAPDFHAIDTLRDAVDAGFECSVVTERRAEAQDATEEWLASWGVHNVPVFAVGHGNKPAYLRGRYGGRFPGAVLVDDNPGAQITIASPAIGVWTPLRPYTPPPREHVREFTSWAQARYWLGLGPQP